MRPNSKPFNVYLDAEQREILARCARLRGEKISQFIRRVALDAARRQLGLYPHNGNHDHGSHCT